MADSDGTGSPRSTRAKGRRSVLDEFLPPVCRWFREILGQPSRAQELAWPVIRRGESALLLAPTGSGKTLAAFLCAIDGLLRQGIADGELPDGVQVLYVTPLKALGNDIQRNLLTPLSGIRVLWGEDMPDIRVAVRSGDTPQSERVRIARRPPHILITTPESLYLMLGSASMTAALAGVRTVIVDEVHALCDNKRGVHLALSLERLQERLGGPLQRIGCSATLRPLEEIAAFLVGYDDAGRQRPCTVLDAGMRKQLDIGVVAPLPDFLESSREALWSSAYSRLLSEIEAHRTTLIFTNSRYKAERTSLRLGEIAPADLPIGVHHGSMSRETRFEAEDALKSGRLRALVATSSLELGIDIGSADLVYQLESPTSVAAGLQRVGRAGHLLDATSKGRILVFDRDELIEAAAVCRGMLEGGIDAVRIPKGCLDVLAQQIAGIVTAGEQNVERVLRLCRRSHPYRELPESQFEAILAALSGEFPFQSPRLPRALVHWDRATGRLSPARGAAQITAMCVGTIPETGEYEVTIEGSGKRVGKVQSEFVDESLRIGDVFVLGSTAWRVAGVNRDRLLVSQAAGATPTVPWWHGPVAPRGAEVGRRVGRLRQEIAARLGDPGLIGWLRAEYRLCPDAARAAEGYVREQDRASVVPTHERLLVEHWRDELGRDNLILHCPLGERLNRTWGIVAAAVAAERRHERWSVTATNDLLALTRHDGSPAPPVAPVDPRDMLIGLSPRAVDVIARSTVRDSAGMASAFRDAAVCGLQVLRVWLGRRVPLWLRNYQAQELWRVAGAHPDYLVTAEATREYLEDALDVPTLTGMLEAIAQGAVAVEFRSVECPSPFAQGVLVGDLQRGDERMTRDRRAQLLRLHRRVLQEVLSIEQMADLLDDRAIARLEERLGHRSDDRRARNSDELADAVRDLGGLPARMDAIREVTLGHTVAMLDELVRMGRVVAFRVPDCEDEPMRLVPSDQWRLFLDAFRRRAQRSRLSVLVPRIEDGEIAGFDMAPAAAHIPARWRKPVPQEQARRAIVERFLRVRGPVTQYDVMNATGWAIDVVESLLDALVEEGKAARGAYTNAKPIPQWVDRANLEEIHRLTLRSLQFEMEACEPFEVVDFLTRWQHRHPDTRLYGPDGLREVVRQLQGIEAVQAAWESEILPGRVADYRPEMLDAMIASGEVSWRRVGARLRRGAITFCLGRDAGWIAAGRPAGLDALQEADVDIPDETRKVRGYFREQRSAFFDQVVEDTGLPEGPVARAMWHLAWCGELTCDTYECIRHAGFTTTLSACYDLDSTPAKILRGRVPASRPLDHMRRRRMDPRLGRWSATERLVPPPEPHPEREVSRHWVEQLLLRWGILTREILDTEDCAPKWSSLLPELKRLELLGQIQRGYFIASHHGEQYALPEAVELLRECRARRGDSVASGFTEGEPVLAITNHDPANLYASSLAVLDARRQPFRPGQRSGNVTVRMAIQAGQVLLCNGHLLTRLARAQLAECLTVLKHDSGGRDVRLEFRHWNGAPVDVSDAAGLLWELGFRFDGRRWMVWPPRGPSRGVCPDPGPQEFAPYFEAEPPVEYGPEWTVSRAAERIRPTTARFAEVLQRAVPAEGWTLEWGESWPGAHYLERARMYVYIMGSYIDMSVRASAWRDGERQRVRWNHRLTRPEGVDAAFEESLRQALRSARGLVGGPQVGPTERDVRTMSDDTVEINRAPVLTLWAAIVAEHQGYEADTALTLGKAVSGLNAQAKGRMIGVFGPPKGRAGETPKKVGLGEDFWLQVCGRPVPAKNTQEGVRAVIKDKPIDPAGVRRYLEGKFKDALPRVRAAMEELAAALTSEALEDDAYPLYERFRPNVAKGIDGWGQVSTLDLGLIRSLAEKARAQRRGG